jgi:hypothetical protein
VREGLGCTKVLSNSEGIVGTIVKSDAGSVPEVELMVRRAHELKDVG